LKGIFPARCVFQSGDGLSLFQIGLFSRHEETQLSVQRQPSVVEAGSSRTVFPWENSDSFGKEYFLKIIVLKVEIGSVCSKEECSAELKKDMYPSKENHLGQKLQHAAHCFSVRT
jgi:hypothetical protein